ncbi:hypothetical protein OKJ48_29525 [Streptomyces kunmingensis]|uniref:Secreted protein n=1 Tax=Streptomyces kunmingensis TaxID=68225 RepID=A0ABU6CI09_9ACTN|nr:hypothetical protein [Streptomyces kunmingensis]MEB3964343.1 hypothetical protein [Streptomyces kunmingensis]
MFQGGKARTWVTLVVSAVLALSSFTSVRAFTPAHKSDQLARSAVTASVEQGPTAGPGGHTHPRDPVEVFRTRDRHRATAGSTQLPYPAPLTPARRPPAFSPPAPATDARARPSRAVPDLTAATLQVFRC